MLKTAQNRSKIAKNRQKSPKIALWPLPNAIWSDTVPIYCQSFCQYLEVRNSILQYQYLAWRESIFIRILSTAQVHIFRATEPLNIAKGVTNRVELLQAEVDQNVLVCFVFKTKFPKRPFFRDEGTPNSFFLSLATLVYACTAWGGSLVMP